MIEVYTVPISKAQFRKLPPKERAMVFVCCHILNQIGVLVKMVRFSSNRDPENHIEETASGTQTQIILRFLIAVLSDACVYFEDRNDLIAQYLPDIHEEGREAYAKVQAFFDKKGLLRMIRNNYLYHYPNDKNVEKAFEAIPEDQPWEWYLSHANTNSLYLSSELVLAHGMMNATGKPDPLEAFGELMAKTMALVNTMPDFLMRLVEAICFKYLGKDVTKPQARTVFSDAPELGTFWIPFFAEPDPEPRGGP
jgi:hypothetical protein